MVAIAFRFPAGRYHATPWGSHVNEAEVEWPPSPWRILRALIATWHRKADPTNHPKAALGSLVNRLASTLPSYRLPSGVRSHTRHYMPQGKFKSGREDTSLVFDAFVRLDPNEELIVIWPDSELPGDERRLLDALLRNLGFLGRAESWVEASLVDDWDGLANCYSSDLSHDVETGEALEPVQIIAPLDSDAYAAWREQIAAAHGLRAGRLKKAQQQILTTLPEELLDALRIDTADLQRAGWSLPPGARFVTYQRPYGCLSVQPELRLRRSHRLASTARLILGGKPLPRIEDAVRIGEVTRSALISQARRVKDGSVPGVLSGHGLPGNNRHGHAFYLAEDSDDDGHIDHVLVHARDGLDHDCLHALAGLQRLWRSAGEEWYVVLDRYGEAELFDEHPYFKRSCVWQSVTPYLHPWHRKKNFTIADQIRRECRERGLPEPRLESIAELPVHGRNRRPVHFHRFRSKRGLLQPDRHGSFWRMVFPTQVRGPIALGFGCHFGLGMFRSCTIT